MPMEIKKNLQSDSDDVGVDYMMDIYQDMGHGFCFPRRYFYTSEADAKHWQIMTELFARRLG
mgnify:CR=1 FL=1